MDALGDNQQVHGITGEGGEGAWVMGEGDLFNGCLYTKTPLNVCFHRLSECHELATGSQTD